MCSYKYNRDPKCKCRNVCCCLLKLAAGTFFQYVVFIHCGYEMQINFVLPNTWYEKWLRYLNELMCTRVFCQLWPPVPLSVPAAEGLWVGLRFRAAAAVELLQVFVQSWRQERACSRSKKRPQHISSTGVCLEVYVTSFMCSCQSLNWIVYCD